MNPCMTHPIQARGPTSVKGLVIARRAPTLSSNLKFQPRLCRRNRLICQLLLQLTFRETHHVTNPISFWPCQTPLFALHCKASIVFKLVREFCAMSGQPTNRTGTRYLALISSRSSAYLWQLNVAGCKEHMSWWKCHYRVSFSNNNRRFMALVIPRQKCFQENQITSDESSSQKVVIYQQFNHPKL